MEQLIGMDVVLYVQCTCRAARTLCLLRRPAWSVRPRQSLGHSDQGHDRDDTHSSTMPARPTSKLPPETKQLYSPTLQTKAVSTNLMPKVRMPSSHHWLSLLGDGCRVAASLCSCSVPAAPLLAGL